MEELLELSEKLIAEVSLKFKRSLFNKIHWQDRLIGLKGARGVGKTTLLLQWLKEQKLSRRQKAYFSLDELYFTTHTLLEVGKEFYQQGGKILVLDEVHKYPTWSKEIKNLYDRYKDLKIIFTGSSIIDIFKQEADLSRRALIYELPGLSYREFLEFAHNLKLPIIALDQILSPETDFRNFFTQDFKPLQYFREYLRYGYYPFYLEYKETFHQRIQQLIRIMVEYDMAEMKGFDIRHAKKMLQLLYIISQEVPYKPNINSLSNKTKIHRNTISNYLFFLQDARLIYLLFSSKAGIVGLQKPEKLYLQNTNLLYALSEQDPSIGTVREVFFCSQLQFDHSVSYSTAVDFVVDGKYNFEIGGKNKDSKQIKNLENAWVVKDDLEYPASLALPLWLFGFLY
jgi:uncharacterized protein